MQKILVVDNSLETRNNVQSALASQFDCLTTDLNQDTIKQANEYKPDIILIDINLPDMDCTSSYENFSTLNCGKKVVIIFISEKNDTTTKIKAYNAGGHDFIAKPFSNTELVTKMTSFGALIEERNTLINDAQDTQSLAMTSMKQASHYGYIMNFFKNLFHSSTPEQVANLFFEAMEFWDLKACLVLRTDEYCYFNAPSDNQINPIERKLFVALKDAGRLYAFGNRLLVNDAHASFLIKNMPKDEAEAGEVRDIVAAIIEGLEAKVIDLKRQAGLSLVTDKLSTTIGNVQTSVTTHNQLISSVVTDMMGTMASSFHSLELTEIQETFFHDLFEKSGQRMMSVEQVLLDIQEQLCLLSNQVLEIIEDTKQEEETTSSNTDLELF
ncbi:response regulator [Paraglaciecola sp.]|uniref:response regulator n=1 Tax=Paraglaciecola sp. TaxID=1920173 RepID=UPI003EF92BF7